MKSHAVLIVSALLVVAVVGACHNTVETLQPEPTASLTAPSSPIGSGPQGTGAPLTVSVVITNAGCVPDRSSVPAGVIVFSVVNEGGGSVSELQLLHGDQSLGGRQNLAPGLSDTFLVKLQPGAYVLSCPGAAMPQTPFTVT